MTTITVTLKNDALYAENTANVAGKFILNDKDVYVFTIQDKIFTYRKVYKYLETQEFLQYVETLDVFNIIFDVKSEKRWIKKNNDILIEDVIILTNGQRMLTNGDMEFTLYTFPDKMMQLDNGKFLYNQVGKYATGLTFILDVPYLNWSKAKKEDFNLPEGNLTYLIGDFFYSKKGTKCFRVKENGTHILIRDEWGGAFSRYRGRTLSQENAVYYRRAHSNGGGCGYDYAVYPVGWKFTISEDDI